MSACARATPTSVDAFHAAALAAGGTSDGAPGLRPQYHESYYAAFIRDPDGNRIEAVTFVAREIALEPVGVGRRHRLGGLRAPRPLPCCSIGRMSSTLSATSRSKFEIAADEFQRLHVIEQRAERLPESL